MEQLINQSCGGLWRLREVSLTGRRSFKNDTSPFPWESPSEPQIKFFQKIFVLCRETLFRIADDEGLLLSHYVF